MEEQTQVSEIPAELQAQFNRLQMQTAGLTVEIPAASDPTISAEIQDTRGQLDALALPMDTLYQNFEAGQQMGNPDENFTNSSLIADTQDSTRQRVGSLEMPDFPESTTGYSGS